MPSHVSARAVVLGASPAYNSTSTSNITGRSLDSAMASSAYDEVKRGQGTLGFHRDVVVPVDHHIRSSQPDVLSWYLRANCIHCSVQMRMAHLQWHAEAALAEEPSLIKNVPTKLRKGTKHSGQKLWLSASEICALARAPSCDCTGWTIDSRPRMNALCMVCCM
jgi:hypothetical protein